MSAPEFPSREPPESRAAALRVLRGLTPARRLQTALELSDLVRRLFRAGLRHRHPDLDEPALQRLYLERLERCRRRSF
jgi:hypothetical protein